MNNECREEQDTGVVREFRSHGLAGGVGAESDVPPWSKKHATYAPNGEPTVSQSTQRLHPYEVYINLLKNPVRNDDYTIPDSTFAIYIWSLVMRHHHTSFMQVGLKRQIFTAKSYGNRAKDRSTSTSQPSKSNFAASMA